MIYYSIFSWWVKLFRLYLAIIMMIFNTWTSYLHKSSFQYFKDYLITKWTLGWSSFKRLFIGCLFSSYVHPVNCPHLALSFCLTPSSSYASPCIWQCDGIGHATNSKWEGRGTKSRKIHPPPKRILNYLGHE